MKNISAQLKLMSYLIITIATVGFCQSAKGQKDFQAQKELESIDISQHTGELYNNQIPHEMLIGNGPSNPLGTDTFVKVIDKFGMAQYMVQTYTPAEKITRWQDNIPQETYDGVSAVDPRWGARLEEGSVLPINVPVCVRNCPEMPLLSSEPLSRPLPEPVSRVRPHLDSIPTEVQLPEPTVKPIDESLEDSNAVISIARLDYAYREWDWVDSHTGEQRIDNDVQINGFSFHLDDAGLEANQRQIYLGMNCMVDLEYSVLVEGTGTQQLLQKPFRINCDQYSYLHIGREYRVWMDQEKNIVHLQSYETSKTN